MGWLENKWVRFLDGYTQGLGQIQDEHVRKAAQKLDVKPLQIDLAWQQEVIDRFTESFAPELIILTGTAGDGKTKLARDIVMHLKGSDFSEDEWNELRFIRSDNEIIVKDYSELSFNEKGLIIDELVDIYKSRQVKRRILIAVNDGILVESLDEYINHCNDVEHSKLVYEIKKIIEDKVNLGFSDKQHSELYNLINLSKLNAKTNLELIFKSILQNDGWTACSDCTGSIDKSCPILKKRQQLIDNSHIIENLSNVILLLQLNNEHFTIRELLNLASNTLLASTPKHPSLQLIDITFPNETLRCKSIAKNHDQLDKVSKESSIEVGFWGMNLGINKMHDSRPYSEINKLEFGLHSSNYWDSKIKKKERQYYLPIDDINANNINPKTLITRSRMQLYCFQRDDKKAYELQRYTSFKEYYNNIYTPLAQVSGMPKEVPSTTIEDIIMALNRVFHGRFISDNFVKSNLFVPRSGLGSIGSRTIFHNYHIDINSISIAQNITDESSLSGSRVEPFIIIRVEDEEVKLALPIELYD